MQSFAKYVATGILAIIPLAVTVWLAWFVVDLLVRFGAPAAREVGEALRPAAPDVADVVQSDWFQFASALLIALALLYVAGRLANGVVGRAALGLVARMIDRVVRRGLPCQPPQAAAARRLPRSRHHRRAALPRVRRRRRLAAQIAEIRHPADVRGRPSLLRRRPASGPSHRRARSSAQEARCAQSTTFR
jgi:hypothetical protein